MVFDQGNTDKEKSKRNNGREDFDVNREQRETDHMRDHQQTVGQQHTEGPALNNGRRALSHKNPGDNFAAQKKKDEEAKAIRFALKMADLNNRLLEIDERLNEIETMQEGINRQLEAIKNGEGVELDQDGNLKNKDAEKALREYEEKYGSVDRTDSEAVQRALVRYYQELNEENRQLTKERDDVRQELVELRNQEQNTIIARKNLLHQVGDARDSQADVQNHKGVNGTTEHEDRIEKTTQDLSTSDEIENFMRGHASMKEEITDPRERMIREQEMVQGLSEEAKEILKLEEEIGILLEPDYFKPLSGADLPIKSADGNVASVPAAKT